MTTIDAAPQTANPVSLRRFEPSLPSAALGTPSVRRAPEFAYDLAIVGLGYVGLPTALAYHHAGSRVLGLDVSAARIHSIEARTADLLDSDRERLAFALGDERFTITSDPNLLSQAAAVIVCVPTPVDDHLIPDLAILSRACAMVVENAVVGQLLVLTSTTYVGCTQDMLVEPLERRGLEVGRDVCVAFSPERIDPGNDAFAHDDVPRVVGAATDTCERRAVALLERYGASVYRVHSLAAAEMTKLLENTFRAVNIALANEFADICLALDLPINDVIDAASTKPYGYMRFLPGPGVGGHCIPCDPHYLLWQLRAKHVNAPLIGQAMVEIAGRPGRVVDRVREVLSDAGQGLARSRVLVVGVAYKPNVADLRESPALEIIESLEEHGATVGFVDDHIPSVRRPDGSTIDVTTDPDSFGANIVILHTRHDTEDLSWIRDDQIVLDTTYRETALPQRILL